MVSVYLELLTKITEAMASTTDLGVSLEKILASFSHFLNLNRGTITLIEKETQTAKIVAAYGLSKVEKSKGFYKIGEGITGHVIQTQEPVMIPVLSQDVRFLNRTGARSKSDKLSFLCVPIFQKGNVIGALSADRAYQPKHHLKHDLQVLQITTTIISHILDMYDLRELDRHELLMENETLRSELESKFQFSEIVGHSHKMGEVFKLLSQVTQSNTTVMIRGESGTGKEMIAHAIHYNSLRKKSPFIKVNCAAIPESLLEAELFGYERGAFTGAMKAKPGKFEMAQKGTIFLDEIGDFPLSTQVKLLRVLQSREVERLGSTKSTSLDVRVVVATNRNVEEDIKTGKFREDLYYRINVFPIYLPPLRERKTDVLLLAEHFLEKYNSENNKKIKRISTPAINMLMSYHWPGNVRELENCIERAVLVCQGNALRAGDMPPSLQTSDSTSSAAIIDLTMTEAVNGFEQEMIIEALKKNDGSQKKASKQLGITERILGYKIKKYKILPKIYSTKVKP